MGARSWIAIAMVFLLASCEDGPIDPNERAALVTTEDWSDDRLGALANAAESWNLELGTRLGVGGVEQAIPVELSEEACFIDRFQETHARSTFEPPGIRVCPGTADDPTLLFETLRHEIGHVVGIPAHANSETAVMTGRATEPRHWFEEEDRALFHAANPGFKGETGCRITHRIGRGVAMIARPDEHPIHLVWSTSDAIRFAPLDATSGHLGEEIGRIGTVGEAAALETHTTGHGFLLSWLAETRINLAPIDLHGGTAPVRAAETEEIDSVRSLSAGNAPPFFWLAISARDLEALHVLQIDDATGTLIGAFDLPAVQGQIVVHRDQVLLVTRERDLAASEDRIRARRIALRDESFELTAPVDIALGQPADDAFEQEAILVAQSFDRGVLVLFERMREQRSIELARVSADGELAVDAEIRSIPGIFATPPSSRRRTGSSSAPPRCILTITSPRPTSPRSRATRSPSCVLGFASARPTRSRATTSTSRTPTVT